MIPSAQSSIELVISTLDKWHKNNSVFFDFESNFDIGSFQYWLQKLAFHDYEGWHYIEEYANQDKKVVQFVYEGGLEQNKMRNEAIEKIDSFYVSIQDNTGTFHSEGMGNIFDRLINDYLKYIHLVQDFDERSKLLVAQMEFTKTCLESLDQDIRNGVKQIMVFQKFKTKGY
jgi:hypothetical protein